MFWIIAIAGLGFAAVFFTSSNWSHERKARRAADEAIAALHAVELDDVFNPIEFGSRFGSVLAEHTGRNHLSPLILTLSDVAAMMLAQEGFSRGGLPPLPYRYDSVDGAKYIAAIKAHTRKLGDRSVIEHFAQTIFNSLLPIVQVAPEEASGSLTFPVSIETAVPDLRRLVLEMILPCLSATNADHGVMANLKKQHEQHICDASGIRWEARNERADRLVFPTTYRGDRVADTYLRGTPLRAALQTTVDFTIPDEARFEHMHVVAGTGHGKTQTLQKFVLHDLDTNAGLVIIDSQGQMLRKIAQLRTDKEIIYVDPTDIERPPALNMFDVSRLEGLPVVKREQFLNGLIELLEYVFAGLLKAELTQKQNVLFRYTLRLMLAVPGATILDLLKVLAEPGPYLVHAKTLNPMAREFLEREFNERSYVQTREQIRRRLYGVLENDAFRRMFSAPRNEIDVAAALNRGAVILVDTAKSHLKADASALMGRYFIALTLQAALERESQQRPAFLYIDEAGEYFDDNIDSLLNEARKRRVGIVMAHQYLDQLTPQLRSSIATNTAIKMAGGISDKDARALASDMRTTPELIASQTKGRFMCFVKNVTPAAVSLEVPFGQLEALPKQPARLSPPPSFSPFRSPAAPSEPAASVQVVEEPSAKSAPSDSDIIPSRDW